jgi:TPR repeat protein
MSGIDIRIAIPVLVFVSMALGAFVWLFVKGQVSSRDETSSNADQFHAATLAYRAGKYGDAYGLVHRLAKAGDVNAQFNLAFLYAWGRGVPNDQDKALNWFRCAAGQGDGEAQLRAGIILLGRAVGRSFAEKRDADGARNQVGLQSEGLYWLRRAAEQGNPEAQYDLGRHLLRDDPKAALAWFERAAKRDHDSAQFELGEIYRRGKGDPPGANDTEAAKWYLLAAERGNSSAQARIGEMLYSGTGTPQDLVKAYTWLNLAAAQSSQHPGLEDYNKRLVQLRESAAARLRPEQITAAQSSSSQWHPRPSTANSTVEWREKAAGPRTQKEPAPPAAYPRCVLE